MSDPADPAADDNGEITAAERAARRRRLAEVFGDVLPDQTSDDLTDPADRTAGGSSSADDWLRRQVPPHHGTP